MTCSRCSKPAAEGSTLCIHCRDKMRTGIRTLRTRRKAKRKCLWCGAPTDTGLCEVHRAGLRGRYAECRELGLCTKCLAPATGWACDDCRGKQNAARRK